MSVTTLQAFKSFCAALEPMPDQAPAVHARMIEAMAAAGYEVYHEYLIDLLNGRSGRIDIVAKSPDGRWLAIEIDARKPRRRSIEKLKTGKWLRISCLRGVAGNVSDYPDLHAIISLPVFAAAREPSRVAKVGKAARGTI